MSESRTRKAPIAVGVALTSLLSVQPVRARQQPVPITQVSASQQLEKKYGITTNGPCEIPEQATGPSVGFSVEGKKYKAVGWLNSSTETNKIFMFGQVHGVWTRLSDEKAGEMLNDTQLKDILVTTLMGEQKYFHHFLHPHISEIKRN